MVTALVDGCRDAAALVVTDAVSDTAELPAVPELMYPGVVTFGVTDTDFDSVIVLVPVVTDAPEPLIEPGAVTEPLATDFVACEA